MPDSIPEGVTTSITDNSVSATAVVDAPPPVIFEFLRRPKNHPLISGDESVRGNISGPELLEPGSRFGMSMKVGVPYRISSKVVEFDQDRLIAWCHLSGHRWRWQLEPAGTGRTRVTETYDQSTAKVPFLLRAIGYPKRHESNVANSVANVAAHFSSSSTTG
jgi:hypothetical protein